MFFPFGGYYTPTPSAEEYGKIHAGEVVVYRPSEATLPAIDVRVVGHVKGQVIVEPTVPSAASAHPLRSVVGFAASGFLVRPLGQHLLLAPVGRLFPPEAADPHWPHRCPRCAGPAYLGAVPAALDCKRNCK